LPAYIPDIRHYQQIPLGGITGPVDCTGWGGALCCDAHSQGTIKVTGRQVRLASNEPVPDPRSPGMNVQQVDDAIYKLTGGRVDFYTPIPGRFGRVAVRDRAVEGQWVNLAVNRGILVDRGYGGSSGFRGSHDITIHIRHTDLAPIIGDTLVPYYYAASWDAVLDAAQAVTSTGYIFASFTRDVTPDYRVSVQVSPGKTRRMYYRYFVDASTNRITGRKAMYTSVGFRADCTPPRVHGGRWTREIVKLTSGSRAGYWLNSAYAYEVRG
jgi:hypothetical protein